MKTVLITGASSGFGLLTAIHLSKKGYKIIATMRNLKNKSTIIELCKQEGVLHHFSFLELDVASPDSVNRFKNELQQFQKIDILVNNAGFAFGGFSEELTVEEYKEQFETNFFGAIRVANSIIPIMRTNGYGKIINIGSISGKIGFPGLSAYAASKHALEGWSESLRLELKPFGIGVALLEPGSFQTNIWSKGRKISERSQDDTSPYQLLMTKLEKHLKQKDQYEDPQLVVDLIVKICESPVLKKLRYPVGKGVKCMLLAKSLLPWSLWERIVLMKLNK